MTFNAYNISYDLSKPGQNYDSLFKAIKAAGDGGSWHCLQSTWIISSSKTAAAIRDSLRPHLDTNDKLIVIKSAGEAAWFGFSEQGSKWLKETV